MEKFMEEYGGAVKVGAVLIGLTVLILFLCRQLFTGTVQSSIYEFLHKNECIKLICEMWLELKQAAENVQLVFDI